MAKKTKVILLAALILAAAFSRMDVAESSAADCYDACSTACVGPDQRRVSRCDQKCTIKCGPDLSAAVERNVG